MRHTVKVYCLPASLSEVRLREIHRGIVNAMIDTRELQVRGEEDFITLFIPDMMQYGLGSEILVEIDLNNDPELDRKSRNVIAERIGYVMVDALGNVKIQCRVYTFKEENGFWSWPRLQQIEAEPHRA